MRLLVTGAGGLLGQEFAQLSPSATLLDRAALDITDAAAVEEAVAGHDVVINTAAWTDVDGAEEHFAAAAAVNGDGPANLALACSKHGARLIQVSTDYVFSGEASAPWAEDAAPSPVNAYGRSKLLGEQAVLHHLPERGYVVRTAWLYGSHGSNFVRTMLRLAETRDFVDVVDDQHGQPTWARELARQLLALAASPLAPPGIYHGTASGQTTWYGLAQAVFSESGLDPARVRPVTSAAFPRPAPRPSYSVLGHARWALAGVAPQPDWRTQLSRFRPLIMNLGW